jgi:hypothetical protein
MGPILDTFTISHDVVGTSCEELEMTVNMGLLRPFTVSIRAYPFTSSVITLWSYKAGGHPCANLRSLVQTPVASSSRSLCLKRKRDREIDLETGKRF